MGVALAAASTIFGGISQYQQSKQEAAQYKTQAAAYQAQADADAANAQAEEYKRAQANTSNLAELRRARSRRELITGQNTATLGAGGISLNSGLALDLEKANQSAYLEDAGNIRLDLQNQDYDMRQQIANLNQSEASNRSAASQYKSMAKSTKRAGLINSILGTATNLYGIANSYSGSSKPSATTSRLGTDYEKLYGSLNTKGDPGTYSGSLYQKNKK